MAVDTGDGTTGGYNGKCCVDGIVGGISGRVSGVILNPNILG